jgi:hypothetical protein
MGGFQTVFYSQSSLWAFDPPVLTPAIDGFGVKSPVSKAFQF